LKYQGWSTCGVVILDIKLTFVDVFTQIHAALTQVPEFEPWKILHQQSSGFSHIAETI